MITSAPTRVRCHLPRKFPALSYALRYNSRGKPTHDSREMLAKLVSDRLVEPFEKAASTAAQHRLIMARHCRQVSEDTLREKVVTQRTGWVPT